MQPRTAVRPVNIWRELKEISMFFQGRDEVHKTMYRVIKRLTKANIPYVVLGGMALSAHRYRRATTDVDILLTKESLAEFRKRFVPQNYDTVPRRPRRFVDRVNKVTMDVLVTGLFPGSGKPGPIAFPDPDEVAEEINNIRFVNLPTLIQLKLSARRHRDFGDVVELIRFNHLDESFLQKLHPAVHRDYIECLEEKRREDEYEARQAEEG